MYVKIDRNIETKIVSVLKFVLENSYSDFYFKKYLGLNLDSPSGFNIRQIFFNLPLLTKDELLKTPPFQRLFADPRSINIALHTSGTSGKEPLIIFQKLDLTTNSPPDCPHQFIYTKRDLKFALVLLQSGTLLSQSVSFSKKMPIFIGNPYKMKETAAVAAKLNIDVIITSPELLLHFVKFLKNCYDLQKIRFVRLGAETLTVAHMELFRKEFPKTLFYQTYGSNEAGQIGFQCDVLAKKEKAVYHVRDDRLFIEIIPTEKNRANEGEIVITHLKPAPSLMIRYRTGDLGEWINKKCECGLPLSLLKLLGRKKQDRLKIGGFEFLLDNFDIIVREFPQYIRDSFEAHFYQRFDRDKIINEIIVKVTPTENIASSEVTRVLIEDAFNNRLHISNRFSFQELIQQKILLPIKVEFFQLDKIPYKAPITKKFVTHF